MWLAALLVWLGVEVGAQERPMRRDGGRPTPQQMAEHRSKQMVEELDLDAEQQAAVEALNLQQAEQMAAHKPGERPDREAMKAQHENYASSLKQILTPEQYEKWEQVREQRGPHSDRGRGPRMQQGDSSKCHCNCDCSKGKSGKGKGKKCQDKEVKCKDKQKNCEG